VSGWPSTGSFSEEDTRMNWTEIIDNKRRSPRRYAPRDDKPLTLPPGEREIWIRRLAPFNRTAGPGTGDQGPD